MEQLSPLAQEAFSELKSKLADFSDQIKILESGFELSVEPKGPDTFPILVSDEGREVTVSALRWHTHEETVEQAVDCVMWLLTPFYRIVETERTGISWVSRLERFEPPGQWVVLDQLKVGFAIFGWKRGQVQTVHQQSVIPAPPELYKAYAVGALDQSNAPTGSVMGSHVIQT